MYMVKKLLKRLMILKLGMKHMVFKVYKDYIKEDSGFTLTSFIARSNLSPMCFKGQRCHKVFIGKNLQQMTKLTEDL